MSQSDPEVEKSCRNKTLYLSFGISLYALIGMKIEGGFELYGFKISLENPQVVELIAIASMLFFWWRHWLVSCDLREAFYSSVLQSTTVPSAVRDEIEEYVSTISTKGNPMSGLITFRQNNRLGSISLACVGLKIKYCFEFQCNGVKDDGSMEISFCEERNKFILSWVSYIRSWVYNSLSKAAFGDALLPSVMCVIAIVSYLYLFFHK